MKSNDDHVPSHALAVHFLANTVADLISIDRKLVYHQIPSMTLSTRSESIMNLFGPENGERDHNMPMP